MRTLLASSLALTLSAAACSSDPSPMGSDEVEPVQGLALTAASSARLIRGQTTSIPVTIERSGGFDGDVEIRATELPGDVTAAPLTIPASESTGMLQLTSGSGLALGTYETLTMRAVAGELEASAPVDVHLTDPAGALDVTFASSGKLLLQYAAAATESGRKIVIQPDGKILIAIMDMTNSRYVVARFHDDGEVDSSFGTGGALIIPDGNANISIGGLAVRGDGMIFLGVHSGPNGIVYAFDSVGKLLSDGWGNTASAAIINQGSIGSDFPLDSLALAPDGGLIVSARDGDFLVARLDANGQIVSSFGTAGIARIDLGGNEWTHRTLVRPDGRIVIAGSSDSAHMNYALVQLTGEGALDTTFSGDGKFKLDLGSGSTFINATLLADGRLALTGLEAGYTLAMFKPNGDLDTSFGGDGWAPWTAGHPGTIVAADDGLVIGGFTTMQSQVYVAKVTLDGAMMAGFGVDGATKVTFTGYDSTFNDLSIDAQGRVVAVGRVLAAEELHQPVIARFWQ